jgi:protein gp37
MTKRLQAMGQKKYRKGFEVAMHPEALDLPLHWRKPRRIFVNSMSDLFHKDVPFRFIEKVFMVMHECPRHTFQILTKRANILLACSHMMAGAWPENVWVGVSVESQKHMDRIESLKQTKAKVKFVSFEPLLGPIDVNLKGLDWVIVGGETGPKARPMEASWAMDILNQCEDRGIPFFFKQGSILDKGKPSHGKLRGRIWEQFPPLIHEKESMGNGKNA